MQQFERIVVPRLPHRNIHCGFRQSGSLILADGSGQCPRTRIVSRATRSDALNSPLTRFFTGADKLTDRRKTTWQKAGNVLTDRRKTTRQKAGNVLTEAKITNVDRRETQADRDL